MKPNPKYLVILLCAILVGCHKADADTKAASPAEVVAFLQPTLAVVGPERLPSTFLTIEEIRALTLKNKKARKITLQQEQLVNFYTNMAMDGLEKAKQQYFDNDENTAAITMHKVDGLVMRAHNLASGQL